MRTPRAALFLLIAVVSACCAGTTPTPAPIVYPDLHPRLGGPTFRIYDVDELDSIDDSPSLYALYLLAEECTGITLDYSPVRVFSVSRIEIKEDGEWSKAYNGMWTRDTGWIYLRTGRPAQFTTWTLVHEYLHYLTKLSHGEEFDEILKTCAVAFVNSLVENEARMQEEEEEND